jgi:hypothetical protein
LVTVVMAVTDKQKVWGIVGGEEPLLMEMRWKKSDLGM